MTDVNVTLENVDEFTRILNAHYPDAIRFAAKNALNSLAYTGVARSEKYISKNMTMRNRNTVNPTRTGSRAVQYNQAKPRRNLNQIESEFGARDEERWTAKKYDRNYLEMQEEGFTHIGTTPTLNARISKRKERLRRSKTHWGEMSKRSLSHYQGKGKTKSAKWRGLLYLAYKEGYGNTKSKQYFYIEKGELTHKRDGEKFKRKMTTGFYQFGNKKSKYAIPSLKKYYTGKGENHRTKRKARPWLESTVDRYSQQDFDKAFGKAIEFQLKRKKLL